MNNWNKPRGGGAAAATANDDEFGDGSFLCDFDVDMAVRQHRESLGETTTPLLGDSTNANNGSTASMQKNPYGKINSNSNSNRNAAPPNSEREESKRRKLGNDDDDRATSSGTAPTNSPEALRATLRHYFGYADFRPGQLSVIESILNGRDTAAFWATGSGKSLCYQIPALHSNGVAVVVSPLISLMQDQVHKLNGLSAEGSPVATFLGSGQADPREEERAMRGEYNVVYLTPEKLVTSLDRLARINNNQASGSSSSRRRVCLVAVDEAHCVSEWGHDFRPQFRSLGKLLREHENLKRIPLLALTATAVPRVQKDICESLRLRNPAIARQSFDRTNLKICVSKKAPGGVSTTLQNLVATLNDARIRASQQSTIVYAPTVKEVEQIAYFLQNNVLEGNGIRVELYHGQLSNERRTEAHTNFLTGRTTVIVATVAFGMGIDKPDTRRIVHYGPPKTLEEYYQQIGRAGRDGLPAECTLYVSGDSDFDKYKTEFYLGNLNDAAREAVLASNAALRKFAMDSETCRRKALLGYFNERPSFGDRCGTCDTCLSVAKYGADAQRDFGPLGARLLLYVVSALNNQGITQILKVIGGNTIEDYRYAGRDPNRVKDIVEERKKSLPKKYTQTYYRDLLAPLVQKGFLVQISKKAQVNGFDRTWTVYKTSFQGDRALQDSSMPIRLPVSESVREEERKEEERRQKVLAELEKNGIKRDKLPQKEVEHGDGEVIRAYSKWHNYVAAARRGGKDERIAKLEALLSEIEGWRARAAFKNRIAPGSVLAEHVMVSIAYATASMAPGMKLDSASLVAAGVRTREIDSLVETLARWVSEAQPEAAAEPSADRRDSPMVFTNALRAAKPWRFAVYKPQKKSGLATWENSYNRFAQGESPQTIALTPPNGRQPVQVNTVVGHILEAINHGRGVDLKRLAEALPPPTKNQWERLREAELESNIDVTADPSCSGPNGDRFTMTEFLRPVVGDAIADTPFPERSEEDKKKFTLWCDSLKWYMPLRRVGYEPSFM